MISFICDGCKKAISNPNRERSYYYLLDKMVCSPCFDEIEEQATDEVHDMRTFTLKAFKKKLIERLYKKCK